MENKLPTAYEWYAKETNRSVDELNAIDFHICKVAIEFAKMHVKLALEDRAENAVTFMPHHPHLHGTGAIDKESILNYDYNKIK